jgi:hypothetical protein
MSSGCWKWLSLFGSRAIVERCHREFKKNFLCSLRNHLELVMHVWIFLRWQVVASIFLKISYMHTKPLTDLFKNKKNSRTFTIFFHVLLTRIQLCSIAISNCWCNCLLAVTIAILLIFLEIYAIVNILRIQPHPLFDIRQNYLFGHTKYEVWFHLTRAESQEAMTVSVPQGFDIGLFEIWQGWCCG